MGREVRGRLQGEATRVHLRLIHVDVWDKPAQCYKVITDHNIVR